MASGLSEKIGDIIPVAIVSVVIITVVVFIVVDFMDKGTIKKNMQDLRAAVTTTCRASVDNYMGYSDGRQIDDAGIDVDEASEEERIILQALALGKLPKKAPKPFMTRVYERVDEKAPCIKADDPEDDSVAIRKFIDYAIEKDKPIKDLLSSDRTHLSDNGKRLFPESLRVSYKEEIENLKNIIQRSEESSKRILEDFKRKYEIKP